MVGCKSSIWFIQGSSWKIKIIFAGQTENIGKESVALVGEWSSSFKGCGWCASKLELDALVLSYDIHERT